MLKCCDDCWMCCVSCACSCTHEGSTERVRHPDPSWTCNNLIGKVTALDSVIHAVQRVKDLVHIHLIKEYPQAAPSTYVVMYDFLCDIYEAKYKESDDE